MGGIPTPWGTRLRSTNINSVSQRSYARDGQAQAARRLTSCPIPRMPTLYVSPVTQQIDSEDLPMSPAEYRKLQQHVNIFCFAHFELKLEFLVKLEQQHFVLTLWIRVCTRPRKHLVSRSLVHHIYFCCPGEKVRTRSTLRKGEMCSKNLYLCSRYTH